MNLMILNTAVVDFRRKDFEFTEALAGKGGLAKCATKDMPNYSQQQLNQWIKEGFATAGGPGNTAPLVARTGLKVAVGVNLGKGDFEGLDAQGRFFYDVMTQNQIDMSATIIHPCLPTGTTFIHDKKTGDRGGIAYFPNANHDFDFETFKKSIENLKPEIVYYMYSGLSDKGDANSGRDLAAFIKWCRNKGIVTIVDSHTLTGNPQQLIDSGRPVEEYELLDPLLGELDLFFTSSDEAKMIENTLGRKKNWPQIDEQQMCCDFLDFLSEKYWKDDSRAKLLGVTVSSGAYIKYALKGKQFAPVKIQSRFMAGEVTDLVGAGDSFRAGFISYVAGNLEAFKKADIDFEEAVQMGNLFASLYIKSPLDDRYSSIKSFDKMLNVVRSDDGFENFEALQKALQ